MFGKIPEKYFSLQKNLLSLLFPTPPSQSVTLSSLRLSKTENPHRIDPLLSRARPPPAPLLTLPVAPCSPLFRRTSRKIEPSPAPELFRWRSLAGRLPAVLPFTLHFILPPPATVLRVTVGHLENIPSPLDLATIHLNHHILLTLVTWLLKQRKPCRVSVLQ